MVLVFGTLGDLVKKIIETEIRIEENPKDRSAAFELLSLNKLFNEWPVTDSGVVTVCFYAMKLAMLKYKEKEKALEELAKADYEHNPVWIRIEINGFLTHRDEIRKLMAQLNELSGGVGKASNLSPDDNFVLAKIGE